MPADYLASNWTAQAALVISGSFLTSRPDIIKLFEPQACLKFLNFREKPGGWWRRLSNAHYVMRLGNLNCIIFENSANLQFVPIKKKLWDHLMLRKLLMRLAKPGVFRSRQICFCLKTVSMRFSSQEQRKSTKSSKCSTDNSYLPLTRTFQRKLFSKKVVTMFTMFTFPKSNWLDGMAYI